MARKQYYITLNALIESRLSKKQLKEQLVLALYNADTNYTTPDAKTKKLEVIEYDDMKINNK